MKKCFLHMVRTGIWLVLSMPIHAQDHILISEVTDPADDFTGRFVELYNPGSEALEFDSVTFYLSRQSNGGTSWGDLRLTGTIRANATFVIGGSGFEAIYGFAPDQVSGILTGNGNDAYFLFRGGDHVEGVLQDIYGSPDTDGTGELWEYVDSRAERDEDILEPSALWQAGEWTITPANVADCDPGTHNGSVLPDTVSPGNYSISMIDDTIQLGQQAEIPVLVSALAAEDGIISYQFDLAYDNRLLEFNGITLPGTLSEGGEAVFNAAVEGIISFSYMSASALQGEGEMLGLRFSSLATGTTELIITEAWFNTIPVQHITNGSVNIVESSPTTATITYSNAVNRFTDTLIITATFSEPISISNPVTISLDGAVSLTDAEMGRLNDTVYSYTYQVPKSEGVVTVTLGGGTDVWGNGIIPVPAGGGSFTIEPFTPGDVDDDGLIMAYDAALTLQYSVGIDALPEMDPLPWEAWRDSTANVDGTGGITAYDASLILRYSAGLISGFSSESVKSAPLAGVVAEIIDHYIVFYSTGELYGFNLQFNNEDGMLGSPVALKEEYMSAINATGSTYRIGLCTKYPLTDGEVMMKVPFSMEGSVTMHIIVNQEESEITIDLASGGIDPGNDFIEIGPVPATDMLRIGGLKGPTTVGVYNIHGELLLSTHTYDPACEIDLAGFTAGLYMIILQTDKETVVRKICIF
jgi:hypothetical protein